MKYAWIDAQRREFPLPDMCEVLAVSVSGYRAWRRGGKPDRTRLSDPQAVALIKSIHAEVRAAYGSRRMHRELQGRGHSFDILGLEFGHPVLSVRSAAASGFGDRRHRRGLHLVLARGPRLRGRSRPGAGPASPNLE